jgi:purine-binding chemotaxis protein CheW
MSEKLKSIMQKQQKQKKSALDEKEHEDVMQLVGFIIGSEELAVPILNIQEIIKPIECTKVPSVPDYVLGVFNLRGSILPLIDLRRKFGLPSAPQTEDTRFIVIKTENNEAGFVIDRLTKAIRINQSDIETPPETFEKEEGVENLIFGIGKMENSIITILNVNALLKRDF